MPWPRRLFAVASVVIGLSAAAPARPGPAGPFPLRIAPNGRHFLDRQGAPVLIQGDAAWSLIAQLTPAEAAMYLDRRRALGFNAVLVNLIEHKFARRAPANAAGQPPFLRPGDLSTPNDAYFSQAAALIELAAARGMAVFLVPAYLGWNGGDEGWFQDLLANGAAAVRSYGRYVGRRLGGFGNIVWVAGGDYTPSWLDRWTVDALAEGLRDSGADQPMTAHCGLEPPAKVFNLRKWLNFDNVYTYEPDVFAACAAEYRRVPVRPYILIEAYYEGEHGTSAETVRKQACAALIAGAAGQFFGNNPVWNFDAPVKVVPISQSWPDALDSRGARDIARIGELFRGLDWPGLMPRPGRKGPPAAVSVDGRLLVAYVSGADHGGLGIDLDTLSLPGRAFWFDPTSGGREVIDPSLFSGQGRRTVPRPGRNAAGDGDWLLVFRSDGDAPARSAKTQERR